MTTLEKDKKTEVEGRAEVGVRASIYERVRGLFPRGAVWDAVTDCMWAVIFFADMYALDALFRVIYRGAALTTPGLWTPNVFTLSWCAAALGTALLLPRAVSRVFVVVWTSVFSVMMLVHCGLYGFSGKFFSFSDIMFADDGAEFFDFSYISIRKIMFIGAFLAIAGAVFATLMMPKKRYSWVRAAAGAAAVIVGVVGIKLTHDSLAKQYVAVSWDSYAQCADIYQSFTDTPKSMMLCGLYQYTARDAWLSSGIDTLFADDGDILDSIEAYYSKRPEHAETSMTGVCKGKNLILVQMEAIDSWMLTPESMPNLYKLYNESIVFENHYAPTYLAGGTFNTELMVNLGFFPPIYGGKTGIYAGNYFPLSLPNAFNAEGYLSRSFHNGWAETYSRGIVHKNWGYERYYSGDDIGMPDVFFDSGLIEGFDLMTEGDKFFSFIVTYSGHGNYPGSAVSGKYYQKFAEIYPDAEDIYIHSMAHAYETDVFIGELVERLEEAGLRDDTVLAFYSDHYNYYTLDDALVMKYKGAFDERTIEHVLFFINDTDIGYMPVDKVTSSIDILPTLVDMFGLGVNAQYYAGDSAFSDGGGYVIFEDNSWLDGERYYIAGQSETDDKAAARNREISDRMYYSQRILLHDYFARRGSWDDADKSE